jgi:hypothetical protein
MSVGVAMIVGAAIGLALGTVVTVTTDIPLAPEAGLALGALVTWLWRRDRT